MAKAEKKTAVESGAAQPRRRLFNDQARARTCSTALLTVSRELIYGETADADDRKIRELLAEIREAQLFLLENLSHPEPRDHKLSLASLNWAVAP